MKEGYKSALSRLAVVHALSLAFAGNQSSSLLVTKMTEPRSALRSPGGLSGPTSCSMSSDASVLAC